MLAPYKLAALDPEEHRTRVRVGEVTFGPDTFVIIAGPCSVETEDQTLRIAQAVKRAGAHLLRGGAYKPRSSPYSFQGLGLEGLKILKLAREVTGLPVITEAVDEQSLALVAEYTDIIQIGARNMQRFMPTRTFIKFSRHRFMPWFGYYLAESVGIKHERLRSTCAATKSSCMRQKGLNQGL